jgi:ABC-2 type transport system ATP-binding protein
MAKHPLISVTKLQKSFHGKEILKDINFKFYDGEILGILGFSGTGKTTLLNLICGLIYPDNGEVLFRIDGNLSVYTVKYVGKKVKSMIGISVQKPSLYPEFSINDNLKYFGELFDMDAHTIEARIQELLKILNLEEHRVAKVKNLSDGMRKRVDIACALMHNPKILILDEPTANLDFKLRRDILNYIRIINEIGVSIIFISHFIEEIEKISTKVLMLDHRHSRVVLNKNIKTSFLNFIKSNNKEAF